MSIIVVILNVFNGKLTICNSGLTLISLRFFYKHQRDTACSICVKIGQN